MTGIAQSIRWLVTLLAFTLVAQAHAQSQDDVLRELRDQNTELRAQLEEQDRRLGALEGRGGVSVGGADDSALPAIRSRLPIQVSGFIKTDSYYQSAVMNSTDAPRFVLPDADRDDSQFGATVQHSRLLVNLLPVDVGSAKVRGLIEMDLFSLGDIGDSKFNNNQLRTRQLYFALQFGQWDVLMGQAWDLYSPLNPTSLNTNGNFWFGGNAGFRRPQLRLTRRFGFEDSVLVASASLNANVGNTITTPSGATRNTGEDSGTPVYQGSLTYEFPLFGRASLLGISAVAGEEDDDRYSSSIGQYGMGLHGRLGLTDWAAVQGEWQYGRNTDAFLAGASYTMPAAGVPGGGEEIKSTSGWVQLQLEPLEKIRVNLHYGLENLYDPDPVNGRTNNRIVGGNAYYEFGGGLEFGLEWDNIATRYDGARDSDAHLIWLSGIYGF